MKIFSRHNIIIVLLDVIFLVALGYGIWFWRQWQRPAAQGVALADDRYPIRGIDISAHNGLQLDFGRVRDRGIRFVYIKATEGDTFRDSQFARNYWAAQRYNLAVGAYHFFRFDCEGHTQAQNLLEALRGRPVRLPLAIDVEEFGNPDDVDDEVVVSRLRAMLGALHAAGYRTMVYTNKKGYRHYIRDNFPDEALWICSFTDPPLGADEAVDDGERWTIWQHSHIGDIEGLRGQFDLNAFVGTEDEFAAFCGTDSI